MKMMTMKRGSTNKMLHMKNVMYCAQIMNKPLSNSLRTIGAPMSSVRTGNLSINIVKTITEPTDCIQTGNKPKSISQISAELSKRVIAVISLVAFFATLLTFFGSPVFSEEAVMVFAAEDTNPQLLDLPSANSELDAVNEALRKQVEDLKKIIALNVEDAEGVPVLLYHHVMNEKDMKAEHHNNHNIISTELFETHMKYLSDNRFYTASIEELEQYIAGKAILPKRTVVITFDDGYRSNTRYCYPILKKYGFKASIFVITSLIGAKEDVIEHASWNDMNRSSDVFSYYSHSHDLHKLDKDGKSMMITSSQSVIRRDMLLSRAFVDCSYIAYPYGQRNQTVTAMLRRTGYRMAFTTDTGYVRKRSNVYELPRFTITPLITTEKLDEIIRGNATVTAEPVVTAAPAEATS